MYIYYNIYIHRTRSAEYFWLRTSKLEALWDRPSYRMRRFNLTAEPGVGGSALRVNGLASGKARKNLGNPMENHGKYWYITYTTSTKQCRVSRIGHGTATLNIDKARGNLFWGHKIIIHHPVFIQFWWILHQGFKKLVWPYGPKYIKIPVTVKARVIPVTSTKKTPSK